MCRQKSAAVHCNSGAVYEVLEEHIALFFVIGEAVYVL
jgi:hypothetical protein